MVKILKLFKKSCLERIRTDILIKIKLNIKLKYMPYKANVASKVLMFLISTNTALGVVSCWHGVLFRRLFDPLLLNTSRNDSGIFPIVGDLFDYS